MDQKMACAQATPARAAMSDQKPSASELAALLRMNMPTTASISLRHSIRETSSIRGSDMMLTIHA